MPDNINNFFIIHLWRFKIKLEFISKTIHLKLFVCTSFLVIRFISATNIKKKKHEFNYF